MKFIFTFLLSLLILISSCSSTHMIKQTPSDYSALNKKFQGEEGKIITKNKKMIEGRNIGIFGDSLYCIESNSDIKMIIHISTISKITITDNSKGAWEGCGYGALSGACALGLIGVLSQKGERDKALGGVLGFIGGAVMGSLYGLAIGAIIGHEDTYVFETSPDTTKIK